MKKPVSIIAVVIAAAVLVSCATTGGSGEGLSLEEAIERSAAEIAAELPRRTRVAIVGFASEDERLSEYIMDELAGALVDGDLEVADRRNLAYVYKELGFQMSGNASDETAVSIGKFLGASHVIAGQLINAGSSYRLPRFRDQCGDHGTGKLDPAQCPRRPGPEKFDCAAVGKAPAAASTANYGETGGGTPKTAGAFFGQALRSQSQGEYDNAIADYTEALRIDPNYTAAYNNRGIAYDNKGLYDRAIEDYTAALRIDPNHPNAKANLEAARKARGY